MVSGVFTCVDAIGVTVSGSDEDASIHGFDRVFVAGLYQPLRRFAGVVGRPDIDPDDLVQEAFVRTLQTRRLDEFDYPGAYPRRVVLNVARSQRRRIGRARRVVGRSWAWGCIGSSDPVVSWGSRSIAQSRGPRSK